MILDFNQSKIMNEIVSKSLERDAGGKPASGLSAAILRPKGTKKNGERSEAAAFPHPARAPGSLVIGHNANHETDIEIRRIKYLNNIVEQHHRAV
jgi:hypothetical protein